MPFTAATTSSTANQAQRSTPTSNPCLSRQPMRIRTYTVIPLARRSGLIEWCEGTVPLGDWLANETSGAHQRYHPTDLTPTQAKLRLAGVRDRGQERKFAVFQEICERLRPVLGYFFLENFPSPTEWHAAKARYTTSLAVSSILGFLVGLGDRHPHNLLLHPATGEVVHIDLGIAFDQGRLLPTPEVVPFRLTRDLIHALGPLGPEAGFTTAAESALLVFASGADVIITLLEVLLHDPLYSWSLSPAQLCALEARRAEAVAVGPSVGPPGTARTNDPSERQSTAVFRDQPPVQRLIASTCQTAQRRSKESANQLAERALLNVRDKLEGRVGGIGSGGLSTAAGSEGVSTLRTAGQINLLLRAATNPENLSRMYFGWQAYL
nr:unnamed protein product [Spirometra erinaceieuropaei]